MGRLKTLKPRLAAAPMGIAAFPEKTADPFYASPEWKALRRLRLEIDGHACVIPGCGKTARIVDHVISRRTGGADTIENLRSLCVDHDNRFKENHLGARRGGTRG